MTKNILNKIKCILHHTVCGIRYMVYGIRRAVYGLRSTIYESDSFTLVELLIVVGIIAILSAAVIVLLNPTELLERGRDSQRISDLKSIQTVIERYKYTGNRISSLGNPNTVYVSLVDASSTACADIGLPALASGWSYNCVTATSTLQDVDGTGWIPINISSLGLISSLPIDPANASASNLYYSYIVNSTGQFKLEATLESTKYKIGGSEDKVSTDGGSDPYLYETGENLTIYKREVLANANFATGDLTGWTNWAGGTTGIVLTPSHYNQKSAIIQGSNSYCNNYYVQDIPVQTNTNYTIGSWIKTVNEVGTVGVGISNPSWSAWYCYTWSSGVTGSTDWIYKSCTGNSGSQTTLRFILTVQWCGGPSPGNGPSGTTYFSTPSVMSGTTLFNH